MSKPQGFTNQLLVDIEGYKKENEHLRRENEALRRKMLDVELAFEAYKARIDSDSGDVKQYAELLDAIRAMKQ